MRFCLACLFDKSCLALMSNTQHAHDIVSRVVAMHGDVTRAAVGDNQLTAKGIALAADQRVVRNNRDRRSNIRNDPADR